jgi:hypothetical protein
MLEVVLASVGSTIAGAAKGYGASFNSKKPAQLFLGTTLLAAFSLNEARKFQERRRETRSHIPGASSHIMDDTIIESSPTYLVDNSPLFVGLFAAAYTVVGVGFTLWRRGRKNSLVSSIARK